MEAKQVKQLMEAYASVYTQSEEIITESECECEEEESDEKEAPEMMGKKKGKKEKEEKGEKKEKEETQKEEVELDEAGLPYGPVGKGFRTIPAGRQREAMMTRAKTLTRKAMAASPEGDGGRGSSRGKMGEINSALLNPRLRPENRPAESVSYESDMFDIILEHLVAEGYADTNKAALAIMANMSEEWKQSIVEGGINFSVPSRIDDFNNRRDELKNRYKQDVGPRIPGPGGGGQYGEPSAPKATGVRLARGTSSSNRGTETKNNA